jgi:hypothetical protein
MKPRTPDGTYLARAFLALQAVSMTAGMLAETIGTNQGNAVNYCWRLRKRGLVRSYKVGKLVFHSAIPGAQAPKDARGKPSGCRNHRFTRNYQMRRATRQWVGMAIGKQPIRHIPGAVSKIHVLEDDQP